MEGSGSTFIVRVTSADAGQLSGTVERVRTGEKHRFSGLEGLGALIAGMVGEATTQPGRATFAAMNRQRRRGEPPGVGMGRRLSPRRCYPGGKAT